MAASSMVRAHDTTSEPPGSGSRPVRKKSAPPPIEVRRSAIQGLGVFATRRIAEGAKIIEYRGERISHAEADRRYDDASMARHHTFLFAVDEESCLDAAKSGNEARFINHSCAPNAWSSNEAGRIFIIAGRDIEAGEEIFYDYSYGTEKGDTLAKLRRMYPCRCGAARCRGTLADWPGSRTAQKKKKRKSRSGRGPRRR